MADPSNQRGKPVHVHIWVQDSELDQMRTIAAARGVTVSALVRGKLRDVPGMNDWHIEPEMPADILATRVFPAAERLPQ